MFSFASKTVNIKIERVNSHMPLKIFMGRASLRVLICALFSTKTIKVGYYMGLTTFRSLLEML
jgi:hypothetical protein